MLVVFAGLPGTGKTTLARATADRLGATFLRVDTVEAAILSSGVSVADNPVGYHVTGAVASDQLRAGRVVVADAVNPVAEARTGWMDVAARSGSRVRFVEVVCSDPVEHRRRVESRMADLPGHVVPTWQRVLDQRYEPWSESRLIVDNLGVPARHVERIVRWLVDGP